MPQLDAHALPPEIDPILVPSVHVNVLLPDVLVVRLIAVANPLQISGEVPVVSNGVGCTVFVTVVDGPAQPSKEVGVTTNSTEPSALLLGLTNVWATVVPLPELAPVTEPVIVPIVQVNVLAPDVLAVSGMEVAKPLQLEVVVALVKYGKGFTTAAVV